MAFLIFGGQPDFGRARPIWANFAHPPWLGRLGSGLADLGQRTPPRFGPPSAGPPSAGPPKISRFFSLLPPQFSFFFLSLGVLSLNFVGVGTGASTRQPEGENKHI